MTQLVTVQTDFRDLEQMAQGLVGRVHETHLILPTGESVDELDEFGLIFVAGGLMTSRILCLYLSAATSTSSPTVFHTIYSQAACATRNSSFLPNRDMGLPIPTRRSPRILLMTYSWITYL